MAQLLSSSLPTCLPSPLDCQAVPAVELLCGSLPSHLHGHRMVQARSKGTCKNITDPMYAEYYYPHIIEGTVRCVSRCINGTQDSMNCFNGVCRVSGIGPHCICNNLDIFWYLDSYCQMPVQKTALGIGLALAVLFVVSIILVIFLIRAKRKNSKNSWSADADIWYGEDADEEWVPSGGLNIMNTTAASSWDEHQDRRKTHHFS
ncbi:mucin-12-like [Pseudonaja textilis]|uniref:mucin-12-like n=1 Tax=Pseudonaja textilis TaxID=8673 RepID=UPI000EA90DBB|nr:mucin-12-like [Pseudonaja textilis]